MHSNSNKCVEFLMHKQVVLYLCDHDNLESAIWPKLENWLQKTSVDDLSKACFRGKAPNTKKQWLNDFGLDPLW